MVAGLADENVPPSDAADEAYIDHHNIASLIDDAIVKLVAERPRNTRMWLASHFAGLSGGETLLQRLLSAEEEVRRLQQLNVKLRRGIVQEHITREKNAIGGAGRLPDPCNPNELHIGSPTLWTTPPARVFSELVQDMDLQRSADRVFTDPAGVAIDDESCLIVCGMQKDMMMISRQNPHGGRLAVPEAEQCAANISTLIRTFSKKGGHVICVRNYHPVQHISFLGKRGMHSDIRRPPSCVQGSPGSEFEKQISEALSEILAQPNHKCTVMYKGIHPDVHAEAVLEYPYQEEYKRHVTVAENTEDPAHLFKWTGAFTLYSSNIKSLEASAPNAPPDVLSVADVQARLHEDDAQGGRAALFLGQANKASWGEHHRQGGITDSAGQSLTQKLLQKNSKIKKVFLAGVTLDGALLETVMLLVKDPRLQHIKDVGIILDATRASYVPGFGVHGSGFVVSPRWIAERLGYASTATDVKFYPTRVFLDPLDYNALLQTHAASGMSVMPTVRANFPRSLGGFGVLPLAAIGADRYLTVLEKPTPRTEGRYTIKEHSRVFSAFESLRTCEGVLSRLTDIAAFPDPYHSAMLPSEARWYCWAYPLEDAGLIAEKRRGLLVGLFNAVLSFPVFGGFVYFDSEFNVVGGCAIGIGNDINFESPQILPEEVRKTLHEQGRFQKVTFMRLHRAGARHFAWIPPGEFRNQGFDRGGFAYLTQDNAGETSEGTKDRNVWFQVSWM